MPWSQPSTDRIREVLRRCAPQLAGQPIAFLAEGWEFWAYTAGDHVLRFPKADRGFIWKLGDQSSTESLRIERALTPELAPRLSTAIPVTDVYCESGPYEAPFAGHRFLPGEIVMYASRKPAPGFGQDLGRLIRELHSVPTQRAVELGVPYFDGPKLRADRAAHYEAVIRRAFPLIACEARAHVERTYEAYLNDGASFDFEPVLVHSDIAVNALLDPDSGGLCGLIDFGDAAVSSPALDLWLPVYGFDQLGIAGQRAECLREAGITDAELDRMRRELAFIDLRYPLIGILHGLATHDEVCVAESIVELNALVPRDLRCE